MRLDIFRSNDLLLVYQQRFHIYIKIHIYRKEEVM
jgi:hypothetical protein